MGFRRSPAVEQVRSKVAVKRRVPVWLMKRRMKALPYTRGTGSLHDRLVALSKDSTKTVTDPEDGTVWTYESFSNFFDSLPSAVVGDPFIPALQAVLGATDAQMQTILEVTAAEWTDLKQYWAGL